MAKIPAAGALPGGCLYEPKWDGFRAIIAVDRDGTTLWSRQGKNLTRHFPDLVDAAEAMIPPGCIIDGEAVIWSDDRLDFTALQKRMTTSKHALIELVRTAPASFAAFDLLAVAGHDTRDVPLRDRRALLKELAKDWEPPLNLSPATTDRQEAERWFEELPSSGLEGLVVKGSGQPYRAERQWLKVKHRDVLDVVCGAVIGSRDQPSELIAGLPVDGRLRIVGRTVPLAASTARSLARHLRPPAGPHPWPEEVTRGTLDRFSKEKGPVHLTLVEPLVIEVSADVAWSGSSFRHPLRYLRARPELDPTEVEMPGHLDRA